MGDTVGVTQANGRPHTAASIKDVVEAKVDVGRAVALGAMAVDEQHLQITSIKVGDMVHRGLQHREQEFLIIRSSQI